MTKLANPVSQEDLFQAESSIREMDLLQTENHISTDQKIVIKAVFGKQQRGLILEPAHDPRTRKLLGVEPLTEEEKRHRRYFVDETTRVKVTDGMVFDLTDEIDRINWEWIRHCKTVALSYEESQMSEEALFYVQNEEREIEKRLTQRKIRIRAEAYISAAKYADHLNICKLLGNPMPFAGQREVEEFLYSIADKTPQRVVDAFEDKNAKVKLFFMLAKERGIVEKRANGLIQFGNITLGINDDQAVEWFKNADNENLVQTIKELVYPEIYSGRRLTEEYFDVKPALKKEKPATGAASPPDAKP
jgi:hypothetical protein